MAKRVGALALSVATVVLAAACGDGGGSKDATQERRATTSLACAWPMFGRDATRTFAYPSDCQTTLSPESVSRLQQKWFRPTSDVVTATPGDRRRHRVRRRLVGAVLRALARRRQHPVEFLRATAEERVLGPDRRVGRRRRHR